MMAEVNLSDWNAINHAEFDGKPEDNFDGTSLHLSFTEYNPLIIINDFGGQDAEVFLLEAVISVQYGNEWIGDVDILSMFGRNNLRHLQTDPSCSHKGSGMPKDDRFVTIDNWKELIDLPESKELPGLTKIGLLVLQLLHSAHTWVIYRNTSLLSALRRYVGFARCWIVKNTESSLL
jgi:hypothetical protein